MGETLQAVYLARHGESLSALSYEHGLSKPENKFWNDLRHLMHD